MSESHSEAWWGAEVVCPFFKRTWLARKEIVCEAGTGRAVLSAMRFPTRKDTEAYLKDICADMFNCMSCPSYIAASEKYDENGNLKEEFTNAVDKRV